MSGGRWVRQDNGDYQHYTDEEYADKVRGEIGLVCGLCLIGGPVMIFLFDELLFGSIITLFGVIGIFIRPAETLGTFIGAAILAGIIWYFAESDSDKKEEKKDTKTEVVSEPPKTQNVYASNYSSEMVDDDIVTQDNEVIEAGENINVENTFLEETSDESLNTQNVQDCRPSFPGGEEALYKYVCDNLKYPVVAEENGIQGKVKVEFDVMEDGSVQKVKVVKSVDPSLDEEACRLMREMPKWTAGIKNGRPYISTIHYEIQFKL